RMTTNAKSTASAAVLAAMIGIGFANSASADTYVFGFSSGDIGTQQLILNGGAFVLGATSTGWYDSTGSHSSGNTNYIAAAPCCDGLNRNFNDFFVFDLTSVTAPITSAVLSITNSASPP